MLGFGSLPQYAPDEIVLRVRVPLAIPGKPLLQGSLEPCVPCTERLVGPERVPEQQVGAPLRVVYGHHVQMMRPDIGCRLFHEEVAPIRAGIPSVNIAEAAQRLPKL